MIKDIILAPFLILIQPKTNWEKLKSLDINKFGLIIYYFSTSIVITLFTTLLAVWGRPLWGVGSALHSFLFVSELTLIMILTDLALFLSLNIILKVFDIKPEEIDIMKLVCFSKMPFLISKLINVFFSLGSFVFVPFLYNLVLILFGVKVLWELTSKDSFLVSVSCYAIYLTSYIPLTFFLKWLLLTTI